MVKTSMNRNWPLVKGDMLRKYGFLICLLWVPILFGADRSHPDISGLISVTEETGEGPISRESDAVLTRYEAFARELALVSPRSGNPLMVIAVMGASLRFYGDVSYRVYPFPVENPDRGSRQLLSNPWDLAASPNGWHRASSLDTKGPNAEVYIDRSGSGNGSLVSASGSSFDFPLDLDNAPDSYQQAAAAHTFYVLNTIHDRLSPKGFGPFDGNFEEDDPVIAVIQKSADLGLTLPASITVPPDGNSPVLSLYVWDYIFPNKVTINTPGFYEPFLGRAGEADFGPALTTTGVTANLILVEDVGDAQACSLLPAGSLTHRIAVIDRGACGFVTKVRNVQNAGALAAIIINDTPGDPTINMPGNDPTITIPSVLISYEDGDILKTQLTMRTLNATMATVAQPKRDMALDTGEIVRLYALAMAERLVGGTNRTDCLDHIESPGPGVADSVALILLDDGQSPEPRGLGTWSRNHPPVAPGLLPDPYQPGIGRKYDELAGASPHQVSAMLGGTLLDLNRLLLEEHGFDPDFPDDSGNGITLRLVIEGLKHMPCHPTFIDVRDGIITADSMFYGSTNTCLIWQAFARRGLGLDADAHDPDNLADNVAGFGTPDIGTVCVEDSSFYETERLPDWAQPIAACTCERDENDRLDVTELIYRFNRTPELSLSNEIIAENSTVGTTVGTLNLTSLGGDPINAVFELTHQSVKGAFTLSAADLSIHNAAHFDHETHAKISITVAAITDDYTLTRTFNIQIQNVNETPELTAPVLDLTNLTQDAVFTALDVRSNFADPDSDELTYTWSGLPDGTGFTTSPTGILSGTPNNTDAILDSINITVTASDGILSANDQFLIRVANINDPPQVRSIPDAMATEDIAMTIDAGNAFYDIDDDPLTFSLTGPVNGSGITIDQNTGTLNVTINDTDVWDAYNRNNGMTIPLTVTATDGEYSVARTFTLTVVNVNDPPVFNGPAPIFDQDQGTAINVDFSSYFIDPDPASSLTYSIENLPTGTGLNIDPVTGIFSGVPTQADADAGAIFLVLEANDSEDSSSELIQFAINDINLRPRAEGSIPDINANQGDSPNLNLALYFFDPDGDTLTFQLIDAPMNSGLTVSGSNITGSFLQVDTGKRTLTVRAIDIGGLSAQQIISLNIQDINLRPECGDCLIENIEVLKNDDTFYFDLGSVFSDPDGDQLTFSLSPEIPHSWSVGFNTATGAMSGPPQDTGSINFTISASDGQLNKSLTFNVTVLPSYKVIIDTPYIFSTSGSGSTCPQPDTYLVPHGDDFIIYGCTNSPSLNFVGWRNSLGGLWSTSNPFTITNRPEDSIMYILPVFALCNSCDPCPCTTSECPTCN